MEISPPWLSVGLVCQRPQGQGCLPTFSLSLMETEACLQPGSHQSLSWALAPEGCSLLFGGNLSVTRWPAYSHHTLSPRLSRVLRAEVRSWSPGCWVSGYTSVE